MNHEAENEALASDEWPRRKLYKAKAPVPALANLALKHLEEAAATFRERNAMYGNNYQRFGNIMALMFPNGVRLETDADFNRFGQLFMCMCKLTRYAENMDRGGHQDSARDLIVYAAMLEEMTNVS